MVYLIAEHTMTSNENKNGRELALHEEHIVPVGSTPATDVYDEELENTEAAKEAIGGTVEELPPGYFRSFSFIGTVLALCLGIMGCYLGFTLPANILSIINDDIGPDPNYVWIAMIVSQKAYKRAVSDLNNDCSGT